ncbi:hypothetical protein EIP91_004377 [Steccherinum ochraceum]|uniref:DNA2/NAM7 helicase-like C-terminal domain-containing protein n=1 Tax=Steccherinum ochraceum TaxID=92696 RepID=A0A4V2MXI3_9APHY|nr:hypothetical protein EIP91_004377 [Steccherinum ochraceum]
MTTPPLFPSLANPALFKAGDPPLCIHHCNTPHTDVQKLSTFLLLANDCGAIGVAAAFSSKGVIKTLALACQDQILLISMDAYHGTAGKKKKIQAPKMLQADLLKNTGLVKLGFDMERIALALYFDHRYHISMAVDAQSLRYHPEDWKRYTDQAYLEVLGGERLLHKENVLRVVRSEGTDDNDQETLSLRAYLAWKISTLPQYSRQRSTFKSICTQRDASDLLVLGKSARDADRLRLLQPVRVKNDVAAEFTVDKSGRVQIGLERYKTRVRQVDTQRILVETTSPNQESALVGRATYVEGKMAHITLNSPIEGTIRSVHTIGKAYTNAELERIGIILAALHRTTTVLSQPLVRSIFYSEPTALTIDDPSSPAQKLSPTMYTTRALNTSQALAVQRILSSRPTDNLCLVQGPPGTGKTTVIAAAVTSLVGNPEYQETRHVWILAQSNVAVKNVAEKLADVGFFDFKLLVSNEFHFEWHEHLYEKIRRNVIVSTMLSDNAVAIDRLLLGSRVILCTLSMLCHPMLMRTGVTRLVPLEVVLVDEASQIEIGDFLPMLHKFGRDIRKLAFIGDQKQLAPYGAEDIKDLRSIFEVDHLAKAALFLGRQYRMPVPIGDFISREVYGGRLSTQHDIKDKNCCKFIDVEGQEAFKGGSYQNIKEVHAVMHIVRRFEREGKSFRVITPYDAQRALLEKTLRDEGLPWEDKCFCVDSFQGNEDDHIIISVVRSAKTGFLSNLRRSNVMLSRCRKSMTICTRRSYLSKVARKTLLGKLAAELGDDAWISWRDLLNGKW